MKTKHFFLAVAFCSVALTQAQWINENDFDQYPYYTFDHGTATGLHLHGDSLIALVAIDEFGIVSDEWLSCMGVYSPHTGALLDALILPNTDSSAGRNLNYWYPLEIGLLNNKSREHSWGWERELEFYDYQLNKLSGVPDFYAYSPAEADSAFVTLSSDTLYWVYPNGSKRYLSGFEEFRDTVISSYGDTDCVAYLDFSPAFHNNKIYLSFYLYSANLSGYIEDGYVVEIDTNGNILNVKEISQGGFVTSNEGGLFVLQWYEDTVGLTYNILRGNHLDSLHHAYTIPQSHIEWVNSITAYRWSTYIKEHNGYVSIVLYENYIDTTYQNPWQRTRALMYDPSGNEVYNFIVKGSKYQTGNIPRFTVLDDSLNCYIVLGDLDGLRLFLAKIGPDGSLGHNETGYRASHTGLEISPNPAKGHIGVQHGLPGKVRYKVYNSAGKVFLNGDMPESSKIDIETLAAGNYWLLVFDDASMLQPKPFVKE